MRIAIILMTAFCFQLLWSPSVSAQQPPTTCADWLAIQSWSGTITYAGAGSFSDGNGSTSQTSEKATATFTTAKSPTTCDLTQPGFGGWEASASAGGQVTLSVSMHDVTQQPSSDQNGNFCTLTTHYDIDNGTVSPLAGQIDMNFTSVPAGTFDITVSQMVDGVQVSFSGCGSTPTRTETLVWGPTEGTRQITVPSVLGPLTGSMTFQNTGALRGSVNWTENYSFQPYANYDVVLTTNPDLSTWRPTGGRTETDETLPLGLLALVTDKDTGKHAFISVDGWTFTLNNCSHEPGVALNWPPKSALQSPAPADLDFFFGNATIFPNLQISPDGTEVKVLPDSATDSGITLLLSAHDWGAAATLNVVVYVAGQTVLGHMDGDTATDILLPKRQQGSMIADNWKVAHNIPLNTPDTDDSEDDPAGDGNAGDGFSLYEEYRGFYMGCARGPYVVEPEGTPGAICQHVEGDPAKKDLFVASDLGAQQNLGIRKFVQETKLNVHYKGLSRSEMDTDRLMNFNFGAGAHLQNDKTTGQHGLYIHWKDGEGVSRAVGSPSIPRNISEIFINSGDSELVSLAGKPNNDNGDNYFTSTVAHELTHSVDVWHHGEFDKGAVFWYADVNGNVFETTTVNAQKQPVVGSGIPIQVFTEDQNPLKDPPTLAWELGLLQMCAAKDNNCPPKASGVSVNVGNTTCGTKVRLGNQHSGDQDCYMRYDNAEAYIPNGFPNVRFYPVDEVTGQHLTDVATGTKVNAPSNPTGLGPLSRYGDADDKRGNCQSQIDVNDLTDPVSRNIPNACTTN
jgi:hypothetical protein